jgi:hypothetical protein
MASHPPSPMSSVKERKVSQSASCKIDCIIKQLFLPMLGMTTPEKTSFQAEEDTILRQVAEECPSALGSEQDFVEYMVVLYRKFQVHNNVHNNVHNKNETGENANSKTQLLANPALPVAAQTALTLQLPVQILEDGADVPKTLSHAVGAAACMGELHNLYAGF